MARKKREVEMSEEDIGGTALDSHGKPGESGKGPNLLTFVFIVLAIAVIVTALGQKDQKQDPPAKTPEEPPTETMVPP